MMKSLLAANRSEKDSFRIPHSVQQSIPIRRIYTDGIWQVGQKYSKTWRFSDINYAASSLDDRRSIFRSYGAVLNSLPTDATAKITIINRRLNPVDFQRTMLMPECSDGLDYYRGEYNQIILDKAAESNNLVQEKYITLSIGLRKIEQTRAYFRRVIPTCPPVSGGWIPGHTPFPVPTGCGSCMTSSVPAKKRRSGSICRQISNAASTSAT